MTPLTALDESRCRELVALVLETNKQFNLTAIRDPEDAWIKHILDSLQALETGLFNRPARLVDVGAGAGFPGLPLALVRPRLHLTAIEATGKKARFIDSTMQHFELAGEVVNGRAEAVGRDDHFREQFDLATARAVGSVAEVAEYCLPLVRTGGHALLWRGRDAEREVKHDRAAIKELGGHVESVRSYVLTALDEAYHLVIIRKVNNTPRIYPRPVGVPRSSPLKRSSAPAPGFTDEPSSIK